MKGNFRTLFKRFCLEGSISGTKYFYLYPDRLSRCFWSLTMAGVLCLAFFLTFRLYDRFQQNPTRITIENQYAPVQNLSYPSITICSPNQITLSAVTHFNKTFVDGVENTTLNLEKTVSQLLGFYEPFTGIRVAEMKQLQELIDLNRYTISEVMTTLPQTCEEFLKVCHFEGRVYPRCRELFVPLLTSHGLCCAFNNKYYLFNKKRNTEKPQFVSHRVKSSSLTVGLTVVADYDPADAVDETILNAGGIRILFTDWTEFPSDDVSNVVPTNTETFSIIHATDTYCSSDVKVLPQESRKCNLLNEGSIRFFKEYHNSDCDHLCLVAAVEAACGCVVFYIPNYKGKACNATSIDCIMKVKMNMYNWVSEECECPGDCESRRYAVDMTIGNLRAVPYMASNIYPGIIFNKSSTIMHFLFHNSVYVKQKQETVMSLISLISNLGGVFGLCVGISALSVVEILFFCYVFVRNKFKDHIRRKRIAQMDAPGKGGFHQNKGGEYKARHGSNVSVSRWREGADPDVSHSRLHRTLPVSIMERHNVHQH